MRSDTTATQIANLPQTAHIGTSAESSITDLVKETPMNTNLALQVLVTATLAGRTSTLCNLHEPLPAWASDGIRVVEELTGTAPDIKADGKLSGTNIVADLSLTLGSTVLPVGTHTFPLPANFDAPVKIAEAFVGSTAEIKADLTLVAAPHA